MNQDYTNLKIQRLNEQFTLIFILTSLFIVVYLLIVVFPSVVFHNLPLLVVWTLKSVFYFKRRRYFLRKAFFFFFKVKFLCFMFVNVTTYEEHVGDSQPLQIPSFSFIYPKKKKGRKIDTFLRKSIFSGKISLIFSPSFMFWKLKIQNEQALASGVPLPALDLLDLP